MKTFSVKIVKLSPGNYDDVLISNTFLSINITAVFTNITTFKDTAQEKKKTQDF